MFATVDRLSLPSGAAVFDPNLIDAETVHRVLTKPFDDVGQPLLGAAGRQGVRLIEHQGRRWVRRHNVRGGFFGRLVRDSYFWLGEDQTRTFREFALLTWMHRRGLPVPAPVAAAYVRHGLTYRCDLLTAYLPNTMTLASHLARGALTPEWQAIDACIRQFHAQGICHRDLNAHNILLQADGHVYLVDFDRGSHQHSGRWIPRNWARLHRSLKKLGHAVPAGLLGAAHDTALSSVWPQGTGNPARKAVVGVCPPSDSRSGK